MEVALAGVGLAGVVKLRATTAGGSETSVPLAEVALPPVVVELVLPWVVFDTPPASCVTLSGGGEADVRFVATVTVELGPPTVAGAAVAFPAEAPVAFAAVPF